MGGGMGEGYLQMHRQVGMTLLNMCEGFFHPNEPADDYDVI